MVTGLRIACGGQDQLSNIANSTSASAKMFKTNIHCMEIRTVRIRDDIWVFLNIAVIADEYNLIMKIYMETCDL